MYEILQQVLSYVRSMWRYRWYAMGLAWVVALGGWGYVYSLPNVYTASSRVHVDTESVLRPLMRGLTVEPDLRQRLSLMTRTLLGRPNMEKLARMTDMHLEVSSPEQMNAMLNRLSDQIKLTGSGRNQNMYEIEYSSPDPQRAKAVVQNLLTIFTESTLNQTRENSNTAQEFLTRQLEQYKARLEQASKNLQNFKRDNAELMPTLSRGYYESLQATREQLEDSQLLLEEATRHRNALRRQLSGEEPVFGFASPPPQAGPDLNNSPLAQRIQSLETERDELLLQYTEEHPRVKTIDQTIKELREQQRAELAARAEEEDDIIVPREVPLNQNPVYQQLQIALAEAEAKVSALRVRVEQHQRILDELNQRVDQMPQFQAQLDQLQKEYEIAQRKYNEFRERQETAALSEEVEEAGEGLRIQVIDPPSVPSAPSGPPRLLFNTAVLILALGTGVALTFVLSQLRPVIHDSRALQRLTGLPIYGSVSRVWTPQMLHRKRIEYGGFTMVGFLLVGAYASVLIYVAR